MSNYICRHVSSLIQAEETARLALFLRKALTCKIWHLLSLTMIGDNGPFVPYHNYFVQIERHCISLGEAFWSCNNESCRAFSWKAELENRCSLYRTNEPKSSWPLKNLIHHWNKNFFLFLSLSNEKKLKECLTWNIVEDFLNLLHYCRRRQSI